MKMPTTSAGGRSRTAAKAAGRKTTLTRSVKARTSSASKAKKTNGSKKSMARSAVPKSKAARGTSAKGAKSSGAVRKTNAKKASTSQVSGAAKSTTNHSKIQQWAEARRGVPATVKSTRSRNEAGVLRIDFPGFSGKNSLQKISWDEWFEKFDESRLAFLYQDKTKDGKQSRFFKLVKK